MPNRSNSPVPAEAGKSLTAELIAVIVAVTGDAPRVLTLENARALPSGPFQTVHRSLQAGLRQWVEEQTQHPLGYIEQLYTFADQDRTATGVERRVISISYLGLTREARARVGDKVSWQDWYRYFPWEDHRAHGDAVAAERIAPFLRRWADAAEDAATRRQRRQRADVTFGLNGRSWNEEMVLQRYELLYEAELVPEASAFGIEASMPIPGEPMLHDHRRILATALARLRAKIKYRPVVFELMPPRFTLLQLQRTVEALAGRLLHKQNFRRLIDQQELVEETGDTTAETGGRPAKLFRFRQEVQVERAIAGTKLPLSRGI
jgi:hypothetical protein